MPTEKVASPFNVHDVSTRSVLFPRSADRIPLLAKFRGVRLCPVTVQRQPREYIEALWRENPIEDDDPGDKGPGETGDGQDSKTGGRQKTNEVVMSKTDPDAALVYRPGVGSMLAHKVHVAVADEPRLMARFLIGEPLERVRTLFGITLGIEVPTTNSRSTTHHSTQS